MLKFSRTRSSSCERPLKRPLPLPSGASVSARSSLSPKTPLLIRTDTRDFSPVSKCQNARAASLERARKRLQFEQNHENEAKNQNVLPRRPRFAPLTSTLEKMATLSTTASLNPRPPPPRPPVRSVLKKSFDGEGSCEGSNEKIEKSIKEETNNALNERRNCNEKQLSLASNPGYGFHRAVEKLVEKLDLQLSLDTFSESGYGSDDNDSLRCSLNNNPSSGSPPPLPTRGANSLKPPLPSSSSSSFWSRSSSSASCSSSCAPRAKKNVHFDSYVLLLQGIRERNLELMATHLAQVTEEALDTEEIVAEFAKAIIENNSEVVQILLNRGFKANSCHGEGLTPLHLAAAFNHLDLVRLLLAHGAAIFARAHCSGRTASQLCSPRLPNFQACQAYLCCMEECLGVANNGRVFVADKYHSSRQDELSVNVGQVLVVVRRGDYSNSGWWWCRDQNGAEGYVIKDLLTLNPCRPK